MQLCVCIVQHTHTFSARLYALCWSMCVWDFGFDAAITCARRIVFQWSERLLHSHLSVIVSVECWLRWICNMHVALHVAIPSSLDASAKDVSDRPDYAHLISFGYSIVINFDFQFFFFFPFSAVAQHVMLVNFVSIWIHAIRVRDHDARMAAIVRPHTITVCLDFGAIVRLDFRHRYVKFESEVHAIRRHVKTVARAYWNRSTITFVRVLKDTQVCRS